MRTTTITKENQDALTPSNVLADLLEGNKRFTDNKKENVNYLSQVKQTVGGQFPKAVILSCIDSRVPAELVFDQGIGDIFSVRVAGNIVNEDVLGSMEYACKVAGSKIIVVMGHTKCGAVTAACKHVEMGNVTALLQKIQPSVTTISEGKNKALDDASIEEVSALNVKHSIEQIREKSPILSEMEKNNEIEIVGAMYDVSTGIVDFYEINF